MNPASAKTSRVARRHFWWLLVCLAAIAAGCSSDGEPKLPPLWSKNSPRLPGKFVWADLVTDDVDTARLFYSRLFGWTYREVGDYVIAQNEERPLGGMIQQARPQDRPAQPRWFGYLSVSSVDRAQRAVLEAGGRVLTPATEFPDRGEQAVFADAEGAVFGAVKSSEGDPQDFLPDPGEWIWIQLLSRDAKKASSFYRAVGKYEVVENTTAGRISDYVLTSDGFARATVRTIPSANTHVQPAWLLFVRVKNVGESAAKAKQLGGKVLIEPKPELLDGKVAVIADPTGAAIGIMEWQQSLAKGVN